jgi:hypothetical protein
MQVASTCFAAVATWPVAQAEFDKGHVVRLLQLGRLGSGKKARETRSENYLEKQTKVGIRFEFDLCSAQNIDFSRQSMKPDVDGLHPEMSKITLLVEVEQIPLIVSYLLLFQCTWLDLSGLLFQSGLSSALAARSVKNKFYLRQV